MADAERGRKQFLIGLGVIGGVLCLLALRAWLRAGEIRSAKDFGALLVFGVLGALAYRGVYWARGAIVVWLGFIAISFGLRGVLMLGRTPGSSLFLIAIAATVAYGAIFLYTSEHIEAFLLSRDAPPARPSRPAV
jgi:hypothetical protein